MLAGTEWKKKSRCQEAEINVVGRIVHIKSAALLGKPHHFSVSTNQVRETKITKIERKGSCYLNIWEFWHPPLQWELLQNKDYF